MRSPVSAPRSAVLVGALLAGNTRPARGLFSSPSHRLRAPPLSHTSTPADDGRRAALLRAFAVLAGAPLPAAAVSPPPPLVSASGRESKLRSRLGVRVLSVCRIMDELQRDIFEGRWDLVEEYPTQLRSFIPVLTAYSNTAFPDDGIDADTKVKQRYEVGRFFGSLNKLKKATDRKDFDAAFRAYADMALSYDCYLRTGILYQYEDVPNEKYFIDVDDGTLTYSDLRKKPAFPGDLILLVSGPDKGRTGTVLVVYDDVKQICVKMDRRYSSSVIREIKVLSESSVALRVGEQDPDEVFLIQRTGE